MESRKNGTDEPICRAGIETQTERKDVWTLCGGEEGRMNCEIRFDINILPCVSEQWEPAR